jgi:hypothetical protein
MDLKLETNVMYAILAAGVLIVFIVYVTRIIRLTTTQKWEHRYITQLEEQREYAQELARKTDPANTQPWPTLPVKEEAS